MPTEDLPVLILGAGAAGLMAARTLALAGVSVRVIEARERIGGRVHTVPMASGKGVVELGAEFIHGRLPVTLALAKEAGLDYVPASFNRYEPGPEGLHPSEEEEGPDPIEIVFGRMDRMGEEDMTFDAFLARYVAEPELEWVRHAARRYVQGFDAADPARVSAQALRRESEAEDLHQFRLAKGYGPMMGYLAATPGVEVALGQVIETVEWRERQVCLTGRNAGGQPVSHLGRAVILTLPLGVWQAKAGEEGAVQLIPPLPEKEAAIAALGFGPALKVIVEGKTPFWQPGPEDADMGFIFTGKGPYEVWWTAAELPYPLLTAWAGGPPAAEQAGLSLEEHKGQAVRELARILHKTEEEIGAQTAALHAAHWGVDPFARGAYSYELANEPDARARLAVPVAGTLFFAGEATYQGDHPGTVEAALVSGKRAAVEVLAGLVDLPGKR